MIASTAAFLAAGRFGLAPTSNRTTTAGLKLVDQAPGLKTGDPAGEQEKIGGGKRVWAGEVDRARGRPGREHRARRHCWPTPPLPPHSPGFTAVDVLGLGALGHGVGVGIILGLRALGKL